MPDAVPDANPPRPSVSSHSARDSTSVLRERNHVLDAGRPPEQELAEFLRRVSAADQRAQRRRPAPAELRNIADRRLEGIAARIYRAEDHLVAQHEVAHHEIGVDLDRTL